MNGSACGARRAPKLKSIRLSRGPSVFHASNLTLFLSSLPARRIVEAMAPAGPSHPIPYAPLERDAPHLIVSGTLCKCGEAVVMSGDQPARGLPFTVRFEQHCPEAPCDGVFFGEDDNYIGRR